MIPFQFRLQSLEHLRKHARDERQAALAESQQSEVALSAQLAALAGQLERLADRHRQAAFGGEIDLESLRESRRYGRLLRSRQQALEQQLQIVRDDVQRRRGLLTEADRDLKMLEKLRARAADRFQYAADRREQFVLDEAGASAARAAIQVRLGSPDLRSRQ